MKAVVTVIGEDKVGIIARVSTMLAEEKVNILDISQTIMKDLFTMIMLVDLGEHENFAAVAEKLDAIGDEMQLSMNIQREDLFKSMHRI